MPARASDLVAAGELSGSALSLLLALVHLAPAIRDATEGRVEVCLTLSEIGKQAGLRERATRSALRDLERAGLLECEQAAGAATTYRVLYAESTPRHDGAPRHEDAGVTPARGCRGPRHGDAGVTSIQDRDTTNPTADAPRLAAEPAAKPVRRRTPQQVRVGSVLEVWEHARGAREPAPGLVASWLRDWPGTDEQLVGLLKDLRRQGKLAKGPSYATAAIGYASVALELYPTYAAEVVACKRALGIEPASEPTLSQDYVRRVSILAEEGWTLEQLQQAARGLRWSEWHMGAADGKPKFGSGSVWKITEGECWPERLLELAEARPPVARRWLPDWAAEGLMEPPAEDAEHAAEPLDWQPHPAWPGLKKRLRREVEADEFATWFDPLKGAAVAGEDGRLVLLAPNDRFALTLEESYRPAVDRAIAESRQPQLEVVFRVEGVA